MDQTVDTYERTIELLKSGPMTAIELTKALGDNRVAVRNRLQRMKRKGIIERYGNGWALVDADEDVAEEDVAEEDVAEEDGESSAEYETSDSIVESGATDDGIVEIRMGGSVISLTIGEEPVTVTLRRVT